MLQWLGIMVNQNCSDVIKHCDTLCCVLHSNIEYELHPKIQLQHTSHLFIYLFMYLLIYLCLHSFIYEVVWVAIVCLEFRWRAFVLV